MMLKPLRSARWVTVLIAVVLMLAWVVPAHAVLPPIGPIIKPIIGPIVIPPLFFFEGIKGTVTDAGTTGAVKGIVVSAFNAADGSYVWSAVTSADGGYMLFLDDADNYKLKFTDPTGKYGEQWANNDASMADANTFGVSNASFTTVNQSLTAGATMKTVVRRAGHPYTRLAGSYVIVQQKSDGPESIQTFSKTAGKYGSATFAGLRGAGVKYKESAIDPKGMFYSADATSTWLPYLGGQSYTVYIDMAVAGESKNVTITVPVSKSSVKKGVRLSVAVGATRKITTSQKMKILAKKGSTTKTYYLPKVSYPSASTTKYRKSIRLPSKGTWKLYAVWPGSTSYAITDSVGGKTVKVK